MTEITSPVKRYPGTVTLPDYLTYPQLIAWEDSIRQARTYQEGGKITDYTRWRGAIVPGICAVVSAWAIPGLERVTVDTFPASPINSAMQLVGWLVNEITRLANEEEDVPNE